MGNPIRRSKQFLSVVAAAAISLSPMMEAQAWQKPHGEATNTGYVIAQTKAALAGSVSIPNIGSFAPGAGPVVAADGTVYIGNEQGKLMAFRADGTPYWSRDIAPGQSIVASPLIDSQGNVYVIGVKTMRDHTVTPEVIRMESTLHKFSASGGWLFQVPFPQSDNGGATTAAPNLWRYSGAEAIMVPISYRNAYSGYETWLLVFSTSGQVMASAKVGVEVPTVTGGSDYLEWQVYLCMLPPFIACLTPAGFTVSGPRRPIVQPTPTAAIFTYAGGGTPFIMVADGFENIVGYNFNFSNAELTESFRVSEDSTVYHSFTSTPMVMPDGHTLVTTPDGLRFVGPNMNKVPIVKSARSFGPPSLLSNGKVVVVSGSEIVVLQGGTVERRIAMGTSSIASAASSSNQFFVSTHDAFFTFDTNTLEQVGRFDWVGGGLNPPAIGPKGNVYAIASNILFAFPSPLNAPLNGNLIAQPGMDLVMIDPNPPTALPSPQVYHPPLTTNGNRLFACIELDGDDCGKGDYREISLAWCQKQGYPKVTGYDVDSRKVKAETLNGQFCSKNKCKVFDTIGCEN